MENNPLTCRTSTHELPPFWDRSAVFVANLHSLFFGNTEEITELCREIGSIESYGGRLIPVLDLLFTKKDNLLVLERSPDPALLDYFGSLGLSMPRTMVMPEEFNRKFPGKIDEETMAFLTKLREEKSSWLVGFVTDASLAFLANQIAKEIMGSAEASQKGNNKLLLHEYLVSSGLPVFDGFKAADFKEISRGLEDLRKKGYRYAVIKAQLGASGIGMIKVDLSKTLSDKAVPQYLFFAGPVLVQGWLDENVPSVRVIASPSVQLYIDDTTCWIYDVTEQILSQESIHQGNMAPPPCFETHPDMKGMMAGQAKKVGLWLAALGYKGTGSIDFHAVERAGALEVRVCEVNARVTGATYPAVLAKRLLPRHAWLMRNLRFSPSLKGAKILSLMKDHGILFSREKDEGVMPINFNLDPAGGVVKGQFLFLGQDRPSIDRLLEGMKTSIAGYGDLDRD